MDYTCNRMKETLLRKLLAAALCVFIFGPESGAAKSIKKRGLHLKVTDKYDYSKKFDIIAFLAYQQREAPVTQEKMETRRLLRVLSPLSRLRKRSLLSAIIRMSIMLCRGYIFTGHHMDHWKILQPPKKIKTPKGAKATSELTLVSSRTYVWSLLTWESGVYLTKRILNCWILDWLVQPKPQWLGGNGWLLDGPEEVLQAEACSTTEDGDEPLHCPTGYECHIINPGNPAQGVPNRGQCIKRRGNPDGRNLRHKYYKDYKEYLGTNSNNAVGYEKQHHKHLG
nr:PREDICTED: WAP four-disulfide core domain protein 1 [Latimeria chalumnae]|eukprot:XP_006006927.1 PREDICTED: WAP four-disulfide core domain protein 1 [Latimeria chalumnae]